MQVFPYSISSLHRWRPQARRLRLQSCSGAPDFSAEEHPSGSCPVRLLPVRLSACLSDSHDPYDVGVRHAQLCGTVSLPCQQPIQTQTEKGKCGQTYKMSYLVKAVALPTFQQRSTRIGGDRYISYLPLNCQQPIQTQAKKGKDRQTYMMSYPFIYVRDR